jgi:small subunit ribosomal protein S4
MARYREPLCRICRRHGEKLFLKGDRCYTEKCSVERRKYPPGQHGQRRQKISDYGIQLREKQKVRDSYSVLEKQFRKYYTVAARKKGVTGETLLQLLETRLDNVVFRLGFAANRRQARQFVGHGYFTVNGRKASIPSYQVREGDVIEVVEKRRQLENLADSLSKAEARGIPEWVELDSANMKGKVLHTPSRDEIAIPAQEQLIVEFYSK